MASQQFSGNLKEEVICPICMDFLQDPATTDCGHNFCHKCIARIAEDSGRFLKCPLCNSSVKKTFRPNWLLVNLVKKIQAMGTSEEQPEGEELKCQKHGEKFYYFCEHDGDFLCVMCRESEDHRMHNASLIEEAAQNYQAQIQCQVEILQQMEKEIVQTKEQGELKINDFMNHVKFERIKILGEFSHLQQVLEEEKNFLLSRLHWLGQEGDQQRKLFTASMELQWTALKKLIDSLKVKQQMLPSQLSEEFQIFSPTLIPPHLEKKLSVAKSRHDSIIENMKKFKGKEVTVTSSHLGERKPTSTPVTLDAASAHPYLILSQDLKTVTLPLHPQRRSEEPTDQERFYPFPCVLGSPGISSGCQAWEAELQGGERGGCLVGVASELVCRRGCLLVEPLAGFWTLRITSLGCEALTDGGTRENLPIRPKKVGIFVDHELGEVVFFDSTTSNHIYTFHASFAGQIFPFFRLLYPGTQITLNP
uniref:E3 ubiquitin-protein ligase TRIM31 n=1 Tax=Sciurus vulgaris TaxID=55149 RepID=A0A8D2CRX2_SCIVU